MSKPRIEISKRTIYPVFGGGRRRVVYDAKLGEFESVGHPTAKAAREAVIADESYCSDPQWTLARGGCVLRPVAVGSWEFVINGRVVCSFNAAGWIEAWERNLGYAEHPETREFFGSAWRGVVGE